MFIPEGLVVVWAMVTGFLITVAVHSFINSLSGE